VPGKTSTADQQRVYVPPAADEPLDAVQLAFVELIVDLVVEEIREEEAARARAQADSAPTPND
jgi:hypothetical protein